MAKDGTVAPKERINIKYIPATGDQQEEKELPLKLMVLGDFLGHEQNTSVEEREAISVDKNSFSNVMKESDLSVTIEVPNKLVEEEEQTFSAKLNFKSLKDFEPDSIVNQVPELKKLIELREALVALKGPLGNVPEFRKALEGLLQNSEDRNKLLSELELLNNTECEEESK